MPVFKLTTQAYCKMILHSAKHPACSVNGVLVAEKHKRKDVPQHQVLFVDCIPLFHGAIALSPVLEVALTLIDTWCKENSYVIAGYYQGNERLKDNSLNPVAERIASRIAEGYSDAALIMVDNSRLSVECIVPSLHVYEPHDNRWKARDPHEDVFEDWPEAQRVTSSLMNNRAYDTLVDFDSHLDDLRNDWANPEINKSIIHLC
ncbi:ER membrane protein complex subunit 8 [Rhinoderma darwinii]|uniref:ER membrane protein complex subunit 8 n=1 Tax=Rhinoderma darwinii TaxID=43563 RepID=UPI003F66F0D7